MSGTCAVDPHSSQTLPIRKEEPTKLPLRNAVEDAEVDADALMHADEDAVVIDDSEKSEGN